jgi:hypothetical protein
VAADVSPQALESFAAFKQNLRWAKAHRDDLEPYAGRYVAVAKGKILEASDSGRQLEEKYKGTRGVYIAVVVPRGTRWVL